MKISFGLLLMLILFSMSCTSCKSSKEKPPSTENHHKLSTDGFRKKLEDINPGIKDPVAIIRLLEMTGADYIPDLINDSGLDSIYMGDSILSAANMGIYTVDIVYLLAYNKDEKFDKQLEKARVLSENIGAGHLYDHAMYETYRASGVPSDTLMKYLTRAAENMEHDFSEINLQRLYTLFACGVFIEKLHLTTQMLAIADKKNADHYWTVMMLTMQQEGALDELLILLNLIRNKEEGERFIAMMNDLKHIFMELNESDQLAGINTQNLSEKQVFKDLVEQINLIRNWIILPS